MFIKICQFCNPLTSVSKQPYRMKNAPRHMNVKGTGLVVGERAWRSAE